MPATNSTQPSVLNSLSLFYYEEIVNKCEVQEVVAWVKRSGKVDIWEIDVVYGGGSALVKAVLATGEVIAEGGQLVKKVVQTSTPEDALAISTIPITPVEEAQTQEQSLKLRDDKLIINQNNLVTRRQVWTGDEQTVRKEARVLAIGCEQINRTIRLRRHGDKNVFLLIIEDRNCQFCNKKPIADSDGYCSEFCHKEHQALMW